MMQRLDYPPIWLLGFLALGWALGQVQGWLWPALALPGAVELSGAVLALAGLGLMVLAAAQFVRRKTTIVPHRVPQALITGGVYRFSRNPIYLADAALMLGLFLYWGIWLALPLVALFIRVITRRFILAEEARLRAAFGQQAETYMQRVRRWL